MFDAHSHIEFDYLRIMLSLIFDTWSCDGTTRPFYFVDHCGKEEMVSHIKGWNQHVHLAAHLNFSLQLVLVLF